SPWRSFFSNHGSPMADVDCPSAEDLKAFVLGELPERRSEALREHLEACPRCEALAQEMDQLEDSVIQAVRLGATSPGDSYASTPPVSGKGAPAPAAGPTGLPERVAGYTVLRELGQGGMGVVFKAEDPKLKRFVALKAMLPALAASARARERFLR